MTPAPLLTAFIGGVLQIQGSGMEFALDLDPAVTLVWSAVSAFLTTLLVGGIMVALAPAYTSARMADVRDDPIGTFVYGFASVVLLVLATVVLVVTLIGILLAVPLLLVAYLVWAVGSAIAFLAVAERLVGREDGWLTPLLLAAAFAGGLTLTGAGGLIAFGVGAAGFGAVLRDRYG
jgi:hypothetical protein